MARRYTNNQNVFHMDNIMYIRVVVLGHHYDGLQVVKIGFVLQEHFAVTSLSSALIRYVIARYVMVVHT
jgi:hypothetical protein